MSDLLRFRWSFVFANVGSTANILVFFFLSSMLQTIYTPGPVVVFLYHILVVVYRTALSRRDRLRGDEDDLGENIVCLLRNMWH